jgi:hypothetical protein
LALLAFGKHKMAWKILEVQNHGSVYEYSCTCCHVRALVFRDSVDQRVFCCGEFKTPPPKDAKLPREHYKAARLLEVPRKRFQEIEDVNCLSPWAV